MEENKKSFFIFWALMSFVLVVEGRPQSAIVVSSTPPPTTTTETTTIIIGDSKEFLQGIAEEDDGRKPFISKFRVTSDIQFRYARTVVESFVKNPSSKGQELEFSMILPDSAFISNFSMIIKDEEYVAEVKKKAEAEKKYQEAVSSGLGAGLVSQREANLFAVSAHVEARGKVRFVLTYDELLQRRTGNYEHIIHVNPGQVVSDFKIDVRINESLPILSLFVPDLKTEANTITPNENPNPFAVIRRKVDGDPSKAEISFKPSEDYQGESGMSGQFVVRYDVDRKGNPNGDIQVIDGYFVHFFAPDDLKPLPKHVVFVLDISGSMSGEKLEQTKDAMVTVIDDLTKDDHFNILTFSDEVYNWIPESQKLSEAPHDLTYPGTEELKKEALKHVLALKTIGGTNINGAVLEALELVRKVRVSEKLPAHVKPILIFLTDGEATSGETTDPVKIKANVRKANEDLEVPIYGLAFGRGADFDIIKTLSLENDGYARRIYEGSDAALQLENFYLEIASPLLSKLKFDYVGEPVANDSLTSTALSTYFKGGEFVVAGKFEQKPDINNDVKLTITGEGLGVPFERQIRICLPSPRPLPTPIPFVVKDDGEKVEVIDLQVDTELPHFDEGGVLTDQTIDDGGVKVLDELDGPKLPLPGLLPRPELPGILPCFPLPPPKPRSQAQNFLERLWAFLTIKDLLKADDKNVDEILVKKESEEEEDEDSSEESDEDSSEESDEDSSEESDEDSSEESDEDSSEEKKPKSRREKALDLALRYNFVTPLTSLVVVRPNETSELVEPTSTYDQSRVVSKKVAFRTTSGLVGGGFPALMAAPPLPQSFHSAPWGTFKKRIPHQQQTTRNNAMAGGYSGYSGSPPVPMTKVFSVDYDYYSGGGSTTARPLPTTTTTVFVPCQGSITLFDKTYLRGNNVTIDDDSIEDLSELDFDDKLTSLEISGSCCWTIFTEPGMTGESVEFSGSGGKGGAGKYLSASDMGPLFREASSLRRKNC